MGYATSFTGEFTLDRPLTAARVVYLKKFALTRRMTRDPKLAEQMPDPERVAVGLPIGPHGMYFTGGLGLLGHSTDASVLQDEPPPGCPGYWCHWQPNSAERNMIKWDGGEKFYGYIEWIQFLIQHFLTPWGYTVNGTVYWNGEEQEDQGRIVVTDNVVEATKAVATYDLTAEDLAALRDMVTLYSFDAPRFFDKIERIRKAFGL